MGRIYGEHEATDSLEFQVDELVDGSEVSLSAMWRAAGSPHARSPQAWVEMAAPMIEGLWEYHRRLDAESGDHAVDAVARGPVWSNDQLLGDRDIDEFHRVGDLMSVEPVARHYALYLDAGAARDAGCIGFVT